MNSQKSLSVGGLAGHSTATEYVSTFYDRLFDEIDSAGYSDSELAALGDPVLYYGRYLDERTRAYFEETVIPVIANALTWFASPETGRVLDLGCGLGMQSLMLAELGKSVLAVDIRPETVALAKKRKRYYESVLGTKLDIEFVCADFQDLSDAQAEPKFDAVFSMSAFSYIKPLEVTVARISDLCADNSRIFLFEENAAQVYARLVRKRDIPVPASIISEFHQHGFELSALTGTCAIPKQAWIHPALNSVLAALDKVMRKSMLLSFSYAMQLERGHGPV